jgi:methyl-accepting chemotaxis protein
MFGVFKKNRDNKELNKIESIKPEIKSNDGIEENKYVIYSLSYLQERMSNLMDSEITISKAVNDVSKTFNHVSESISNIGDVLENFNSNFNDFAVTSNDIGKQQKPP